MAAELGVMLVTLLLGGVVVGMYLRECAADESRIKARIPDPRSDTVAYAIPTGFDPLVLQLGLDRAGFTSEVGRVGKAECVLVTCKTTERAVLRGVLEAAQASAYVGTELKLNPVVFEDER
jgi:hypothetical protein